MIGKIVVGRKGVVSDHPLSTMIGTEILREGGNAFDAAIAVSAALSVLQPHSGGIGGDGFLLGFIDNDVIALSSSGRSPRGFNAEQFLELNPTRGPLTVTIPGLVYLWGLIHDEYSTMKLEELLAPAIKLAYNGFHVGSSLANAIKAVESELSQYRWAKYFKGLTFGDLYRNLDMAKALKRIASRGWDEFYYGELAEQITSELQDQGVDIGLDDLMEHEGYKVRPLKLQVDDMVLYELPPNTQGISTLQLISALYELSLDKLEVDSPERIKSWSKPTELVYLFRDNFVGDPDYMTIDPQSYVSYSKARELLSSTHTSQPTREGDTTFFIVSDGESIVGFIQSLFHGFGSGLIISGFPVQNRGIGFAKRGGLPNSPAPSKLPLHTLSILGVEKNGEKFIIGCVGGDLRPQLHLRVFENIFVYNMRIDKAVAYPRFAYSRPYGIQQLVVEKPLYVDSLHGCEVVISEYGGLHGHVHVGILRRSRVELACDPRSEGIPLAIGDSL